MKYKLLNDAPLRTYAVVFDPGEEVVNELTTFARAEKLNASQFTGIGALSSVVLGYFQWDEKSYKRIPVDEQVEVVSLLGDIAISEGKASLHPHIVVSRADGSAMGGHLLEARVRPIVEVIVTESPERLRREHDEATGLALISLK